MTNKTRIQTGFLEKQAKENSRQGTSRSVMLGVGAVAVIALAFGVFKAAELLMGFQTYQHVRNVALLLNSPKMEGNQAFIDVTIRNGNAYPVADPVFKFSLANSEGSEILSGEKQIKGIIPTGDQRTYFHVNLGTTNGAPARLRSDLSKVTATIPESLPAGFPSRFSTAMTSEDPLKDLTALQKDAPDYAPLLIAIGILNEGNKNWQKAEEYFRKAVEIAPENANAHYHLGVVLMREKQEKVGMEHIQKAAMLNENDPEIKRTLESLNSEEVTEAAMR